MSHGGALTKWAPGDQLRKCQLIREWLRVAGPHRLGICAVLISQMTRTPDEKSFNFSTSLTCLEVSVCGYSPWVHNCVCSYTILFLCLLVVKQDRRTLPYFLPFPEPFDFLLLCDSPWKAVLGSRRVISREQTMPPLSCLPGLTGTHSHRNSCNTCALYRVGAVSSRLGRRVLVT